MKKNSKEIILLSIVCTLGSLALIFALISQHVYKMEPCYWCVLQRLEFVLIVLTSIVGILNVNKIKIWSFLLSILSLLGALSAMAQIFSANAKEDCSISLAEKIISFTKLNEYFPYVFESYALCSDSNYKFLGLDYPIVSFLTFIIIMDIVVILNLNIYKLKK